MTELAIGTAGGSTTSFSALTTPVKEPSKLALYPAAEYIRTVDGASAAVGSAYCVMSWDAMTRAQRNQLKTFCTGASAAVKIYIPTNDAFTTFATYTAIMHWPITERWKANNTMLDIEITFTNLVAV